MKLVDAVLNWFGSTKGYLAWHCETADIELARLRDALAKAESEAELWKDFACTLHEAHHPLGYPRPCQPCMEVLKGDADATLAVIEGLREVVLAEKAAAEEQIA